MTLEKYQGTLLGLALGDALGAPHEGGPVERLLWRAIGKDRDGRMRWTDDTQMSVDLAESLIAKGTLELDDLAVRFARSYRWTRGYGPAAAKLLKRIARGADWHEANRSVYPVGSFGNGGAMRAPVVGLWYSRRLGEIPNAARLSASVTHAHPLGQEGAVLIAVATALALSGPSPLRLLQEAGSYCQQEEFVSRVSTAITWLQSGNNTSHTDVARTLGNGIAAPNSCVTAVYIGCRFLERPFTEMQRFVVRVGGDTDTIGAMAGAIWGAANGVESLPREQMGRLEQSERLLALSSELYLRSDQ